MPNDFEDDNVIWRRCERAWASWLAPHVASVTALADVNNNAPGINAPVIRVGQRHLRAPDLQAVKNGVTEFWEVKYRTRASVNHLTGAREHWMSHACAMDYAQIFRINQQQVWVILFEAEANNGRGQWLRADIETIIGNGRVETKFANGMDPVEAYVWPRSIMVAVDGPEIDLQPADRGVLPDEGDAKPIPIEAVIPVEREVRRRPPAPKPLSEATPQQETHLTEKERIIRVLERDNAQGLDALTAALGLPATPKYSVLRIGDPEDVEEVLGLLHYGIRVFLISTAGTQVENIEEYQAFIDSRLLEWATVPEAKGLDEWIIDGHLVAPLSKPASKAMNAADAAGQINVKQYLIVHADQGADMIVEAGAGTGKTETMSERVVFLLATNSTVSSPTTEDFGMDDIVLVTFTKEASRQMRERLAKTLNLRLRLSRRCVLPALAWMMQLSSTKITTIHSYAKSIAQEGAGVLGLSPSFRVSSQTMDFRRALYNALSPHLETLFTRGDIDNVPPAHLWREFVDDLWETLENNGIELMPLINNRLTMVDWPKGAKGSTSGAVVDAVTEVMGEIGEIYAQLCIDNQAIPTAKLISTALASLTAQASPPVTKPRYVFIDEFQDTDAEQMDLMVRIRESLGARLFVVGDVKQGIYRFRGANGSAFDVLRGEFAKVKGLDQPITCRLTRNFRSGQVLLDSLHPYFDKWSKLGILDYKAADQLLADVAKKSMGTKFSPTPIEPKSYETTSVSKVDSWWKAAKKSEREVDIAILCRNNWTAIKIRKLILEKGIPCELVVGGDFYRSPAVREMRVLLEAVCNPDDTAALLELLETRWAEQILLAPSFDPHGHTPAEHEVWIAPPGEFLAWRDRFVTLKNGNIEVSDLSNFRERVRSMGKVLDKMPLLSWIAHCITKFSPELCDLGVPGDQSERERYGKCLDHLLTLLDVQFADAPMTLPRLLDWMKLKIATDFVEDEPFEEDSLRGKVTALTVHKAKGLEFDYVLLPYTWEKFVKTNRKVEIAIETQKSGRPRIAWRWRYGGGAPNAPTIENVPAADPAWTVERKEQLKEEARLLYVAMTRARLELVMLVNRQSPGTASSPACWGDLVK